VGGGEKKRRGPPPRAGLQISVGGGDGAEVAPSVRDCSNERLLRIPICRGGGGGSAAGW
jgi:hypothetical protein